MTPSNISIRLDDVEISDRVVYSETSFTSQANPMQGSFRVVVRDPDQDFSPQIGKKLTCHIDGVPMSGGYLLRITRGHFLPVVDTTTPGDVRSRRWILEGPDFNVLFDKRVLYDPDNPVAALVVPSGRRTISKAFRYMMNNFIDVPAGLDYTTHVDVVDTSYGTEENGGLYVGQSKTWRDQMDDFADNGGIIYYIDADFAVHLHEYEQTISSWSFTDSNPNGVSTIGFREGEFSEDFTRIVTEALVWGGSTIRAPGGPEGNIVFAQYPDPPAADATWHGRLQSAEREQAALDRLALYGRWQYAEERAGQSNFLTLGSVKNRAFIIINGPPGAVPTHGLEGGFSQPESRMQVTWFAHDVPSQDHIRPGNLHTFILRTQGDGVTPLIRVLPLRSMRISFPTLPTDNPGGETYVRFEGEFGTSYSDSRHLWKFIRQQQRRAGTITAVTAVDNSTAEEEGSVPAGALASLWPLEVPDGVITEFTFPYTFFDNQFDLYLNGLFQRPDVDYTYDADTRQVTFTEALGVGDQLWADGFVSQ